MKEHLIVDGLDVQYATQGMGPVVLLLHGWGSNQATFNNLIAAWGGEGMRFVTLDLPGFGGSEVPAEAWDVSRYASFVVHFLAKLGIEKPEILVGHSLGGRISIKAVSRGDLHPKKVVLIASAGTAKSRSARNLFFMVIAKVGKALSFIPPFSFFRKSLRKKLYSAAGSSDYLNAGHMQETFLHIIGENLTEDARKISIPTLLVWGEHDTQTPLAEAQILHEAIKGSALEVIPQAGHFVHEEKAQEVAGKIAAFTTL